MKYHVGKNGPTVCKAVVKECPIGGEHYSNRNEALKAFEEKNSEEFGEIPTTLQKNSLITLSSNLGEARVADGDLSDPIARSLLVSGLCGDLAKSISEKTGKPPYFVFHRSMTNKEFEEEFENNPNVIFNSPHVLVESVYNEDRFVDAYGVHDSEDVEEHWEGSVLVRGSKEMLDHWCKNSKTPDLSNFAETVIKFDKESVSYDYEELEFDYED